MAVKGTKLLVFAVAALLLLNGYLFLRNQENDLSALRAQVGGLSSRLAAIKDDAKRRANEAAAEMAGLNQRKEKEAEAAKLLQEQHQLEEELKKEQQQLEEQQKQLLQQQQQQQQQVAAAGGVPSVPSGAIAILVIACDRVTVKRCLDVLLKYKPPGDRFKVVVSQDCGHAATEQAILEYQDRGVKLIKQPDLSNPQTEPGHAGFVGYYKIARHYKFALSQVFDVMKYSSVVIVEDDLDIAPDFFEYFLAGERLLNEDKTLWCITAWNDNGKEDQVVEASRLYRSDFFGGLGWMMHRDLWDELRDKWPKAFWDDWMREKAQRKDRSSIRPEISRTKTFGRVGVSQGQFYDTHLQFIRLNDEYVSFTDKDLRYLQKVNYDTAFNYEVYKTSQQVSLLEFRNADRTSKKVYRIEYDGLAEFARIAMELGAMQDDKAGVPRTAYMGVVTLWNKGRKVHIAPKQPWRGY